MNCKIIGKALLVTLGLFAAVALLCLLFMKAPLWLTMVIGFLAVFSLIYSSMKKYDDMGDSNDRMSWYSNDEEDEQ